MRPEDEEVRWTSIASRRGAQREQAKRRAPCSKKPVKIGCEEDFFRAHFLRFGIKKALKTAGGDDNNI